MGSIGSAMQVEQVVRERVGGAACIGEGWYGTKIRTQLKEKKRTTNRCGMLVLRIRTNVAQRRVGDAG